MRGELDRWADTRTAFGWVAGGVADGRAVEAVVIGPEGQVIATAHFTPDAADAFAAFANQHSGKGSVYVCLNLVVAELASSTGRTKASDVPRHEALLLDIDPARDDLPPGRMLLAAIAMLPRVFELSRNGEHPLLLDSGRGAQLWLRPAGEPRAAWEAIRKDFTLLLDRYGCRLDSTCDAVRLARVPGTVNLRTGRVARIIPIPRELPRHLTETLSGIRPDLNDHSRSGLEMAAANALAALGFTEKQTIELLKAYPHGRGETEHPTSRKTTARKAVAQRGRKESTSEKFSAAVVLPPATDPAPAETISLAECKARIAKWLAFSPGEDLIIDVALAAKLANDAPGDPVFIILVGPSSGAKTELLRAFHGAPGAYLLGRLTARTLASGLDPKKASLLNQLPADTHTLVVKDLGAILALTQNERGELFQQLRDLFDGLLVCAWGSGKGSFEWTGRLGLLAGATPAIEREFNALATLGERFIFYRVHVTNRELQARRAQEISGREKEMRSEIHQAIVGALAGVSAKDVNQIALSAENAAVMQAISCALTQGRTPVMRDRWDKSLEFAPELEAPARTAKALKKIAQALAALRAKNSVENEELTVIVKIGVDSLPSLRRRVMGWLFRQPSKAWQAAKQIGEAISIPTQTVTRQLEDLAALKIVERRAMADRTNAPFEAQLTDEFRDLLIRSALGAALDDPPCETAERDRAHSAESQGRTYQPAFRGDSNE